MSLSSLVAKIGVDPEFIAFQAHCWFAYAVVYTLPVHDVAGVSMLIGAGVKEFYFDKHFEVPAQPFAENLRDFLGYATGVLLAACALHL